MTTEDETVEGRAPRKNKAIQRSDFNPSSNRGKQSRQSRGKTIKVVRCITI